MQTELAEGNEPLDGNRISIKNWTGGHLCSVAYILSMPQDYGKLGLLVIN